MFGPGDTEPTNAKATSPTSRSRPTANSETHRPVQVRRLERVLYDPPVLAAPGEWVRAWRPAVPGIREVFHARFVDHAYPPHTHDTWTVFIVDEGAIRYDLDARHRGADGTRVTLLPPHVVHDGRAATGAGFRKRVLYLAPTSSARRCRAAVDGPDVADPALARGSAAAPAARGTREARGGDALTVVGHRLRGHLGERRRPRRPARPGSRPTCGTCSTSTPSRG